jgi:hypothetical protein
MYSVYSGQTSPCDQLHSSYLLQTLVRLLSISKILGAICQADDDYQRGSHLVLGPDGHVEGLGVSHQRAVEDDVGLTSYVRRQE